MRAVKRPPSVARPSTRCPSFTAAERTMPSASTHWLSSAPEAMRSNEAVRGGGTRASPRIRTSAFWISGTKSGAELTPRTSTSWPGLSESLVSEVSTRIPAVESWMYKSGTSASGS